MNMRCFVLAFLSAVMVYQTDGAVAQPPTNCEYHSDGKKLVCEDIIDPAFVQDIAESTELM